MKLKMILVTLLICAVWAPTVSAQEIVPKGFKQVVMTAGQDFWVPFSDIDKTASLGSGNKAYTPAWIAVAVEDGPVELSLWRYSDALSDGDYIISIQPWPDFRIAATDTVFIVTDFIQPNLNNSGAHGAWVSSITGGTIWIFWE